MIAEKPTLAEAKAAADAGNPETASAIAMEVARKASDKSIVAQALHFAGINTLSIGSSNLAFSRIKRAIIISPERSSAYANLAQKAQNYDAQRILCQRAVVANPLSASFDGQVKLRPDQ